MTALDKERYVADWTAKHSPESAASAAARRRLPSAPSKDEVTDESLREVEKILARSELNNPGTNSSTTMTTSNIRPSYKPSLKPLIDNTGTTSYRSLPYSTNYTSASSGHTTRLGGHQESAAARASIRRKPLSGTSSYLMSRTSSGSAGNRSNSCLTSQQAEYQAWKTRKESITKKTPSSVNSSCNSSSSSASSTGKQNGKLTSRMSQSLISNTGNMKRSNSFHHENIQNGQATTKENGQMSEPVTYRTSDDYYLDEDELFLPLYSTEEEHHDVRGHRKDQLSALDSLGKNMILIL